MKHLKNNHILNLIIVALLGCMLSCNKDKLANNEDNNLVEIADDLKENNRITFSKVLAKSLENVNIRELIKEEAAKRFNKDTEILFALVKDKIVVDNTSFFEYLASIHGSKEGFEKITNSLPVLTILVPHLPDFDVEKWKVNEEIPLVAVYPTKTYRKANRITTAKTFDASQIESSISFKSYPNYPLLVVKDNERVYVNDAIPSKRTDDKLQFTGSTFSYSFVDKEFNNLDGSKSNVSVVNNVASRLDTYNKFDSRVRFAYENNLQYPRDYVYYNIAPSLGLNTGTFNNNYAEFLTSFELANSGVFGELHDDPITDSPYADGDLEFIVKVFVMNGSTGYELVSKWFDVPYSGLVSIVPAGNNTWTHGVTRHYVLPTPLELAPWNMQQFGNKWKITLFEEDATTTQTIQYSVGLNSTFGTNYSNNIKDGPNFGSSSNSTFNYGASYTFQLSGGHDNLYDAILSWDDKILFWDEPALGPGAPAPWNQHWARSFEYNTGKVKFSIEPKLRY